MQKVVSLAVRFPYNGKNYSGISVKSGVSLSLTPAACGVPKTRIVFENGSSKPLVFIENVSGADFESAQVPDNYLVIHPKA